MNDDEAFIRAIVGSPGDETPRLVYADWLEERGDRRAAYFRAEAQAVQTGDTSKVRQSAEGLDPVWVARVTRPPLGVCCEHVPIRDRGPVITPNELAQFEQQAWIAFPPDYRAFLLNYNGGVLGENHYETAECGPVYEGLEHTFYSLNCRAGMSERTGLEWWASLRIQHVVRQEAEAEASYDPLRESWFFQFVQIGESPDPRFGVMLGVVGSVLGEVRHFDSSVGYYPDYFDGLSEPYAASFAAYLATLPRTYP